MFSLTTIQTPSTVSKFHLVANYIDEIQQISGSMNNVVDCPSQPPIDDPAFNVASTSLVSLDTYDLPRNDSFERFQVNSKCQNNTNKNTDDQHRSHDCHFRS